jgi:UMF1 family MFS transporter
LGGLISLFIVMVTFVNSNHHWFDQQSFVHIRITALFCAIWIMIFTLPLFLFVQDIPSFGLKAFAAIHQGFFELGKTIRSLHKSPTIFKYLIARMIYTDGLNTLFAFGGIYAVGTFHFTLMEVVLFGVILNITSGLGAAIFSWLDDYLGSKRTILISLTALIMVLFIILLIHSVIWFWIIAPFVGLFIGPTQASSRTFLIRLAPPDRLSEMFGLYALSGRATAFIGPFLVGEITLIFNSQRVGMSIILAFLFVGCALLYFVNEPKKSS